MIIMSFAQLVRQCLMHSRMHFAPLGYQGSLLTPVEPATNQPPHILFFKANLQSLLFQFILVSNVILSRVQNLAFVLVKLHAIIAKSSH